MSRSQAREVAFQSMYARLFNAEKDRDINNLDLYDTLTEEDDLAFVAQILRTSAEHYADLNKIITDNLVGYTKERLFKVDLAIIFVSLCELMYIKENPPAVIINEAVELAKKYSTEKSYKFINGFLSSVVKKETK